MKKAKTELTNQDLFEAIQLLAENMEQRFQSVDKRFEVIDRRFEQIDRRFEQVDDKFRDITTTLDYLTTTTLSIRQDHVAAIDWLKRHEKRLDRHELDIHTLRHSS